MQLNDKVAVVTGGGSGIGEAIADRFVAEGARHVVVADLHLDRAQEVAGRHGDRASAVAVDVADEAALTAMVESVLDRHGPIDVFVSNAGYGRQGGVELPTEAWDQMWRVHVLAHVVAARAVLPAMIAHGGGYLVNTASAAGLLTQLDSAVYAVTKSAAVSLGEWLAINHHHQGVRVSVLCPQAVRTRILEAFEGPEGRSGPSVASGDGVLEAGEVAGMVVDAMAAERFLILPHAEVQTYVERKATDRDRWLAGMRRFADRLFGDGTRPGDRIVS
jgi:NAD(P)-dependent dehydrogenase (short-subunit alcohol dehydrogenase family)